MIEKYLLLAITFVSITFVLFIISFIYIVLTKEIFREENIVKFNVFGLALAVIFCLLLSIYFFIGD